MVDHFAQVAALDGVAEAAADARAAVDKLLSHRMMRNRSAEVTAEAAVRSARASAALDGVDVPLEALRATLAAISGGGPTVDPVLGGALRLAGELGSLLPPWENAPRQGLARMHVLAARGTAPDELLGRPRGGADPLPSDPLGLGPAPAAAEAAARVDGLSDLLLRPTVAPAIVVAAIVHGELLAVRPFGTLDGPVARTAARLVLTGRGLDPKAVTVPDVGHVDSGEYGAAAKAYVAGGREGVARWVRHCALALQLGAREGLAVCEAMRRAAD